MEPKRLIALQNTLHDKGVLYGASKTGRHRHLGSRGNQMSSLFDDDVFARQALEALRWPQGPRCTHCDAGGTEVFKIGGRKQSHRDGLYHCKLCRKQFTVTLGTVFERSRITLSTWLRA